MSDHSIVKIKMQLLNTQSRGKSYWKFNNKLLHDQNYINLIKQELLTLSTCNYLENKNTKWDFIKCQLRTVTITYSKHKAQKAKMEESHIKEQLENLEKEIIECTDHNTLDNYNTVKEQWDRV